MEWSLNLEQLLLFGFVWTFVPSESAVRGVSSGPADGESGHVPDQKLNTL